MNHIDIVKKIANDMIGIGGIPSNQEFYEEFNFRVQEALKINSKRGEIVVRNFQYSDDATKWINKNNINVVSIADAGRFSEGVRIMYRVS
jgi:hypothetical protein